MMTTSPTRLSRSAAPLSSGFCCHHLLRIAGPTTPGGALRHPRFGLLRVRSPLLAESLLFSFPPGTEMFQFPGLASILLHGCRSRLRRVAPFGNPRVRGYLPLAAAYRSLSRPSSPPRAKASFMCPSLLSFNGCIVEEFFLKSRPFIDLLGLSQRSVLLRSVIFFTRFFSRY